MATSKAKPSRRLAKLGASNIETVGEVRRRQADLLRGLEQAGIEPGQVLLGAPAS